ncbi:hypothetical protein Ancab_011040 [Ancistrocladus abbreviatus]
MRSAFLLSLIALHLPFGSAVAQQQQQPQLFCDDVVKDLFDCSYYLLGQNGPSLDCCAQLKDLSEISMSGEQSRICQCIQILFKNQPGIVPSRADDLSTKCNRTAGMDVQLFPENEDPRANQFVETLVDPAARRRMNAMHLASRFAQTLADTQPANIKANALA